MSSSTSSSKLESITGMALDADKKAKAAKEQARLAKSKLKTARKGLKSAKRDLKVAKKMARKALKESARAREALQQCLAKVAKEKTKAKRSRSVPKSAEAPPKLIREAEHAFANGMKRNGKRGATNARPTPSTGKAPSQDRSEVGESSDDEQA